MSFAQDQGYVPATIEELMDAVMEGINDQFGTTYTTDTFVGTNFYKYFYALIQLLQENEIRASEIITKLQQYFVQTNEALERPKTTSPGVLDELSRAGYTASVKPMIDADAGKVSIAVDVDDGADDYDEKKLEICTIIKDCVPAGVVSQGTEVETIALSNDQSFDFKFSLPSRHTAYLRLTIAQSTSSQDTILSDDDVKALLLANVAARYRFGADFEPQRYFSVADAPWAATVLLEWSDDAGANWHSTVFDSDFDDLFEFDEAHVTIVNT